MGGVLVMLLGGGSSCQQCGCSGLVCWDGETFSTASTQASSTGYLGGGFVTPSGGLTLTSVTIYQSGGLGEPLTYSPPPSPQPTNAPRLRILNDDSGSPNSSSVVATLTRPTDWTADEWVWTHAGLSLTGSTTYWVELSCPGTQTMRWKWDGYPFAEAPTAECYYLRATSTNSGTSWSSGTDTIRFLFDIN